MLPCFTTCAWWPSAKRTALLLLAVAVVACDSPPEYRTLSDGTEIKLIGFGADGSRRDSVVWLRLAATVTDPGGDTLLSVNRKPFPTADDPLWQYLAHSARGDTFEVRFTGGNFLLPRRTDTSTAKAGIKVLALRSAARMRDARFAEYDRLDTLMRSDTVAGRYSERGGAWYRITETRGDTVRVRRGREIVIRYRGSTLDGRVFDDSRLLDGDFRFVYGNEGQVLPGIEAVLGEMCRGETAEIIIPSALAFGSKGSADGRVGPYTTVFYKVEVREVARE